jgi:hypothetical protein
MNAYKEIYRYNAANKFGVMMDFAANDCDLDGDTYLHMFISCGLAEQFERGDPRIIAGMSGVELAIKTIEIITGKLPIAKPATLDFRTAEFWGGWALGQYQWYNVRSFGSILRFLPFSDIL